MYIHVSCIDMWFRPDLMQGASPTQAFASLPSSMRGIEDDSSFLSSSGDPVWSLDREEVTKLFCCADACYLVNVMKH